MSRRAAARLTLRRAIRVGARVSEALLLVAIGVSIIGTIVPVSVPVRWTIAVALAAGALATLLAAILRPIGIMAASRLLDRQLQLQERLSTALELAFAPSALSALGARVIADALTHAHGVDLRKAFPLRPPREAWWSIMLAVILIASNGWFRGVTLPGTPARRTAQVIREEGHRLERIAQTLQARTRVERTPQTRRLTVQLRDLGVRLQRDRVDRAEALARIEGVVRQAEQARKEVADRLETMRPSPRRDSTLPSGLLPRQALEQQIKQLQELNARLRQDVPPADRQSALERLAAMAQEAREGGSAQVQRHVEYARDQLQHGNIGQASEAVSEALRTLEGMQSLLADEEGLRTVRQQLERSGTNVASGAAEGTPRDSADVTPPPGRSPTASGTNPVSADASADVSSPPRGPNAGVAPGVGQVAEKLSDPTARLQGPKSPERLRGAQGQGVVSASEVLGPARPGSSRAPVTPVPPTLVPQADRYMERARIPAHYRLLVRRYFERLAHLR